LSVYDRKANGRGRYDLSTFVGWVKISEGPLRHWFWQAERQWVEDGRPDREQDPSNPYWALQTYKTIACARTLAELDRLIDSATWAGWYDGYRGHDKPKQFKAYYVSWGNKRSAKAVDRVRLKLRTVREKIRSVYEETGYMPVGMGVDGKFIGYRGVGEAAKADEVMAALATMEFIGGFGDE